MYHLFLCRLFHLFLILLFILLLILVIFWLVKSNRRYEVPEHLESKREKWWIWRTSSLAECHHLWLASVSVSSSLSLASVGCWSTSVIWNLSSSTSLLADNLELFENALSPKHNLPQISALFGCNCITNHFLENLYTVWPGLLYDQRENATRLQRTKRTGNHKTICEFLFPPPSKHFRFTLNCCNFWEEINAPISC